MLDLVPPPKLQHPCSAQQATSKSVLFFLGKYCYLSELLQQQLFAVLRCAQRCLQGCKTRKDAEGQKRILRGSLSIKQLWLGKVCITSVAKSFSPPSPCHVILLGSATHLPELSSLAWVLITGEISKIIIQVF